MSPLKDLGSHDGGIDPIEIPDDGWCTGTVEALYASLAIFIDEGHGQEPVVVAVARPGTAGAVRIYRRLALGTGINASGATCFTIFVREDD